MMGASIDRSPHLHRNHSKLVFGLVVVAVGVILLLDRMGVLYARDLFRFWPVILIVIGLLGIFNPERPGKLVSSGIIGLAGVILLLSELDLIHVTFHEIWPVFIIAAGLLMIWGALHPNPQWTLGARSGSANAATAASPHLNVTSIFSDGHWNITAQDFENGSVRAVFGGFKVDLTQAEMVGPRAYINLDLVFGGGEIRIPNSWNVLIAAQPIFGSCEDKTRRLQPPAPDKTLVLAGRIIFGGVEIRN